MRPIDGDALAGAIGDAARRLIDDGYYPQGDALREVAAFVKTFPAIEAEPVQHGRWEKGGYACGETEWKCSVCGETEWRTSCSRMKFCMFCGAKMDAGGA